MKKLILTCIGLMAFGCASKIVKTEELKAVKKVAIIGFDLQQQRPVSGSDLLAIVTHSKVSTDASVKMGAESAHVDATYKNMAQELSSKTGWKVTKIEDLRKHPAYVAFVKSKTEGFQNRPIINDRFDLLRPTGVVDNFAVLTTEKEKLTQLAKDLGVDAVVTASTTVNLNANGAFAALTGNGEYKPSGRTTLMVKNATTAENIIMLSGEGPQVETGVKNVAGLTNEENLNKLVVEATGLSVRNVLNEIPSAL